ncbi:MAG: hypothetical protein Q9218_007849 [Villophora microphyllina]
MLIRDLTCCSPASEALQPPDQDVHLQENKLGGGGEEVVVPEDEDAIPLSGLSLDETHFTLPSRPSYGTKGKAIVLRANYFPMSTKPDLELFRYNIDIQPPIKNQQGKPNRRKIRRLMELLVASIPNLRKEGVATDYGKFIYAAKSLLDGDQPKTLTQQLYEVEEGGPDPKSPTYKVTIAFDGKVGVQQLVDYISKKADVAMSSVEKGAVLQALNIIVTRTANENPDIYGGGKRNKYYYYPANFDAIGYKLGGGLIAMKGFYTSVRTSTARLLVNINIANAAFYPAINLLGLMRLHTPYPSDDAHSGLEAFITRLRVSHQYMRKNMKDPKSPHIKKIKTVQGFAHPHTRYKQNFPHLGNANTITFECPELQKQGKISVASYFKQKYNVDLAKPGDPCINLGTKEKPNFVPPELLTVLPGQQYARKLDEKQTKAMINFAVRPPAANARRIVEQGAGMMALSDTNKKLKDFGIKVFPQMITVRGRILPQVPIQYKVANKSKVPTIVRGAWNLQGSMFTNGRHLQGWTYIKFVKNNLGTTEISTLRGELKKLGMGHDPPFPEAGVTEELKSGRGYQDTNDKTIERIFRGAAERKLQFLLVILPSKDAYIYSRVKFWGDVHYGIHTVCSIGMSLALDKRVNFGAKGIDYSVNLAHKINLKLGGLNQALPSEQLVNVLKDGKTMLVGMDVTHPSPGSLKESPSIAGVVASVDGRYGQWPASLRAQKGKQEMIEHLDEMFDERLSLWRTHNQNALPQRVIIYRDGVSEGQYAILLNKELPQIRKACEKRYPPGRGPKISLIVCGKRHHTRFYPTNKNEVDQRSGNPINGTVVDRGVTMERGWDFFLQAHHSSQGTARPTHYVVLLEENGLNADDLEALTHNLCYHYGRCPKAVSLCPPAYYADLLCERGRMYLYNEFNARDNQTATTETEFDWNRAPWLRDVHPNLKDTMFYI